MTEKTNSRLWLLIITFVIIVVLGNVLHAGTRYENTLGVLDEVVSDLREQREQDELRQQLDDIEEAQQELIRLEQEEQ